MTNFLDKLLIEMFFVIIGLAYRGSHGLVDQNDVTFHFFCFFSIFFRKNIKKSKFFWRGTWLVSWCNYQLICHFDQVAWFGPNAQYLHCIYETKDTSQIVKISVLFLYSLVCHLADLPQIWRLIHGSHVIKPKEFRSNEVGIWKFHKLHHFFRKLF